MPAWRSDQYALDCIKTHRAWIEGKLKQWEAGRANRQVITDQMRQEGIAKAKEVIPRRVAYYAARMGLTGRYNRITIKEQKTRWGSCSTKGNLNFNWRLMLMPDRLLDYVVVHELAHLYEMNHSSRFWRIVEGQIPDYKERRELLNQLGKQYQ